MGDERVAFVINAATNIPLALLAVAGNTLILASFASNRSLISPSYVFIISLSITDLSVGLLVQPLYIAWRFTVFYNQSSTRGTFLSVVIVLSAVSCFFSLLTVTCISADRFLALHLHLRYNEIITVRRVSRFLVVLFLISILICSVTIWFPSHDEIAGGCTAFACFIVNAVMYWKMYRVARQHQRKIFVQHQQQQQPSGSNTTAEQHQRQELRIPNTRLLDIFRLRKSTLSMFYVYLICLLCYLPYISLAVVYPVIKGKPSLSIAFEISWTFVYLNSSLNPLLYSWRLKEIRSAVKKILLRRSEISTKRT